MGSALVCPTPRRLGRIVLFKGASGDGFDSPCRPPTIEVIIGNAMNEQVDNNRYDDDD